MKNFRLTITLIAVFMLGLDISSTAQILHKADSLYAITINKRAVKAFADEAYPKAIRFFEKSNAKMFLPDSLKTKLGLAYLKTKSTY